jgi:TM2 domain-containing membrane protein YozV
MAAAVVLAAILLGVIIFGAVKLIGGRPWAAALVGGPQALPPTPNVERLPELMAG